MRLSEKMENSGRVMKKAKTETIRETVLRMHKKGLDIEMIAEIAGITQNDVKNIFALPATEE